MTHAYANSFFGNIAGEHVTTRYRQYINRNWLVKKVLVEVLSLRMYMLVQAAGGYNRGGKRNVGIGSSENAAGDNQDDLMSWILFIK